MTAAKPAGSNKIATLTGPDGKVTQLPIVDGSVGPSVIDVR